MTYPREVVAGICIAYLDNIPNVLLGLKPSGHWEFPGGKVEKGETNEAALEREWVEELDTFAHVKGHYTQIETDEYNINFYLVGLEDGWLDINEPIAKEHVDVKWVPIEDLDKYEMLDTNTLVAELIQDDYL